MNKFLKYNQRTPLVDERKISYSQYAMYSTCPKHWELAYVKDLRTFSQSIHTIFGTAFHETLQNYLTVMFEQSVTKANQIERISIEYIFKNSESCVQRDAELINKFIANHEITNSNQITIQ